MHDDSGPYELSIAGRVRRSRGRAGRVIPVSTKVTRSEQHELEAAAKLEGKSLSEWARDVLLSHARRGRADDAVFTELIALRLLLNAVLRAIVLGRKMTEAEYDHLLTEVRQIKHETAQDVLSQYNASTEGGR